MGLFDSAQPQGGGPAPDSFWDRFRAQYAPGAYSAHQQSLQQQAIYSAMVQNGASPSQAQALALSPQFFQSGQAAYMPQAPQVQTYMNSGGDQVPIQVQNPGGRAGHGLSISGIPVIAPGTTANPTEAAGGAPAQPQDQGGPAAAPVANTIQGMPGSTQQMLGQIDAARNQGVTGNDLLQLAPREYRDMTQAVLDGRMTLKEIAERRGNSARTIVTKLALGAEPNFDENMNEARNVYRKSYMSTQPNNVGFKREALGTTLEHLNSTLDSAINMHNSESSIGPVAEFSNRFRQLGNEQGAKANDFDTRTDTLAGETAKFITGKPPAEGIEKTYKSRWNQYATPQQLAAAGDAYLELISGKMRDMERERDANFANNPSQTGNMPIALPEHQAMIEQIKKKIAALKAQGGSPQAEGGAPAGNPSLPSGWKLIETK
jgi:hypothetical protein